MSLPTVCIHVFLLFSHSVLCIFPCWCVCVFMSSFSKYISSSLHCDFPWLLLRLFVVSFISRMISSSFFFCVLFLFSSHFFLVIFFLFAIVHYVHTIVMRAILFIVTPIMISLRFSPVSHRVKESKWENKQ